MNKKGAMQLSINMIVILIIAVVILGLALGFINGMFGKMTDQFDVEEPEPPTASASTPVTMSRGSNLKAGAGEKITVKWSVYCDRENVCTDVDLIGINCGESGGTVATLAPAQTIKKTIPFGQSATILTLLDVSSEVGKKLCTAEFKSIDASLIFGETFDFSVEVT